MHVSVLVSIGFLYLFSARTARKLWVDGLTEKHEIRLCDKRNPDGVCRVQETRKDMWVEGITLHLVHAFTVNMCQIAAPNCMMKERFNEHGLTSHSTSTRGHRSLRSPLSS